MGRNWLRTCSVSLSGSTSATINGGGDTDLKIVFSVKFWTSQTPNACRVRVYNISPSTRAAFQNKQFQRISLSSGYQDNMGLIFQGDIKQSIYGHENAVDTYIDIFAADGQNGYQQGRMSKTLAKGYTPMDVVNVAVGGMAPFGISLGKVNVDLTSLKYPRGAPLAGLSRESPRMMSLSAGALWSINFNKPGRDQATEPRSGLDVPKLPRSPWTSNQADRKSGKSESRAPHLGTLLSAFRIQASISATALV